MAFDLDNFFQAIGRAGREDYAINQAQAQQATPFDDLIGYSYINPAWITQLTASYDSVIRNSSVGMSAWAQAAGTILQAMVVAEAPAYGSSLGSSLLYLRNEMIAQGKTVQSCTITGASVAESANVGTPAILVITTRGDGLVLQNTIAEESTLYYTDDAYTGSATVGQEPYSWVGAANISSLGTGIGVGTWDWDWPQGSNGSATGTNIAGDDEANTSGNYLTNGAFDAWTGGTPALDNWYLETGTWGTTIQRTTTHLGGTYSVEFIVGATLNGLTQQFDSDDSTGATAGTAAILTAFQGYGFNIWLRAAGVISGGVMTVSLVDGSAAVINDQQGTANSTTIALTAHSTNWVAHPIAFRLPVILPSIVRLKIKITTALAGANLYMDWAAFGVPTNFYVGGPNVIAFSNPAAPVEAGPDPDGFTITTTNNRGGASFGATMQTLVSRLYQTPDLILPYSATPNISDGLITTGLTFPTPFELQLALPFTATASGVVQDTLSNGIPWTFQVVQSISISMDISSIIGKIEESTTGVGAWTDVAGGTFDNPGGPDDLQDLTMTRTKRYIRYTCTITPSGGSPSAYVSAIGGYY